MQNYKRFSIFVLGLSGIFIGIVCFWLFLYDPLQVFHKPYFRKTTFSKDMRLQDKGIIKHYDFDSFIIGDSATQNIPAMYTQYKLGDKWVNITPVGSGFYEKYIILKYLFVTKEPKNIIYGLNVSLAKEGQDDVRSYSFLYDKNPFNDIKVYLNRKFIGCALVFSKSKKCVGYEDLENLTHWMDDPHTLTRLGQYNNWFANEAERQEEIARLKRVRNKTFSFTSKNFNVESFKQHVQDYIFSLVKEHPQTKFYFLIPIYPTYFYKTSKEEYITKYFQILKWFVDESEKYTNVVIYGLSDLDYVDDLSNYKDHVHYSMEANVMQIDSIAEHKHIINTKNIDSFLKTIEDKTNQYNVQPLIDILMGKN
ncbi:MULTISPECIES: hypothetical protein [unclassified Helicobacter]|uniref:hypothetical protein n=1 Tax=unclassified Helicobacter TaxID=2593540 RepID=UPI000CF19417|nr:MULTISPECIES: hypothetical protein [unclassified Helicobacter]